MTINLAVSLDTVAHACNPDSSVLEIGRIMAQGQFGQKVKHDPISTNKPGSGIRYCNPSYMGVRDRRIDV
jgi:hypothetical protein